MNVVSLVARVQELYDEVDDQFSSFRQTTGIDCPIACGICCLYPRVMTGVLDFLPYAKKIWDEGSAFDVYRSIQPGQSICTLHGRAEGRSRGMCTAYRYRGFICRTFGFQLVRRNEGPKLATCPVIAETHAERITNLSADSLVRTLPFVEDLRKRFQNIDPVLAAEKVPVNKAIRRAIEVVFESGYRPVVGNGLGRAA